MIEQGLWSLDNEQRQIAENQLASVMNTDFSKFVMSMMEVLVDTTKPTSVRQMAAILFKRAISSLVNLFYLSG